MRIVTLTLLLLLLPTLLFGQNFILDDGIVKCEGVQIGATGTIFGEEYEAVDRELLIQRRDEGADLTKVCVSNVTDMSGMFQDSDFNQPIGNWDVSNVTDMSGMFQNSEFNQSVGDWNVSSVIFMAEMFKGSIFNQPINRWCVLNFSTEPFNFSSDSPLILENKPIWGTCPILDSTTPSVPLQLSPENNSIGISPSPELIWTNDSLSTKFQVQIFQENNLVIVDSLTSNSMITIPQVLVKLSNYYWRVRGINESIRIGGEFVKSEWSPLWKFTIDATGINPPIFIDTDGIVKCEGEEIGLTWLIDGMTYEVVDRNLLIQRKNEGADLTKVCVSNVTDMSLMFQFSNYNQPIGNWDVSNVTDMSGMFWENYAFNQPIGNWNVRNVTNMSGMFSKNYSFNQPIGNWNVSNVNNMSGMFQESGFNQPIGNWDVGNVTDMSYMFDFSEFNQSVGNWDVGNVTDMNYMFGASEFNQPIGNWDVSSVTDMSGIFSYSQFNQSISNWDVSKVNDMSKMFMSTPFNQPIGNWDVGSVATMNSMFHDSEFNQNISGWCVRFISSEPSGFSSNSPLTEENKPIWGTCSILDMSTPSVPVQLSPQNNSIDVSPTPELSWTADSLSTSYQLQVFRGFDPIVVDTLITESLFTVSNPLIRLIDYYWRVRGVNENAIVGGEFVKSEWSPVWKFVILPKFKTIG